MAQREQKVAFMEWTWWKKNRETTWIGRKKVGKKWPLKVFKNTSEDNQFVNKKRKWNHKILGSKPQNTKKRAEDENRIKEKGQRIENSNKCDRY